MFYFLVAISNDLSLHILKVVSTQRFCHFPLGPAPRAFSMSNQLYSNFLFRIEFVCIPHNRHSNVNRTIQLCLSEIVCVFSGSVFTAPECANCQQYSLLRLRYTYYPINKPCENVQGLRLYTLCTRRATRRRTHTPNSTSTASRLVPMLSSHTTTLKSTTWV